jgi:hypothetical protein
VAKREFAPGLPDPRRFGRVTSLPIDKPLRFVIQKHLARRAGPHFDIRFGPDQGHKPTLLSWAGRKLPAEPGQKTLAFRQPLHTGAYADFEGEITSGYGKGTVKTHDKGSVLVTKVSPDKINFVVIHKKHPETFTMVRKSGPPLSPETARKARTQGGTWLMINTTPTDVIEHKKVHYATVPAKDVAKLFDEDYLHNEKIDGAAALYQVLSDRIEVLSYRPTSTGRPIVHTYRVGGTTGVNIPKHLVGSVMRGELYGVRHSTGRAIPPQELGGILNASTMRSLSKQKEQGVELRSRLFNVLRYGKKPVGMEEPLAGRLAKLKEIVQHLPSPKFGLPEMAGTPEEQRALWERITAGKHPLTAEGVVAWPKKGGKPTKVKLYDESDVFVREIFPGAGKLEGAGAGGFQYSLEPEGPIVGKVGTGFTEATRKQMWESPAEFKGRVARIKAQGQFPSGAYRAPAFLGLHEDYPAMKAASLVKRAQDPRLLQLYQQRAVDPRTVAGVGKTLAGHATFWPALATVGSTAKALPGLIRGKGAAGLGGRIAARWAPAALAGNIKTVLGKAGLPIAAALGLGGAALAARKDPEYQAGRRGYMSAYGKELGRRGDVAQEKAREAFSRGLLSGGVTSALSGITNPVSTLTGLGQSAWRAVKSPFQWLAGSKEASPKVLAPVIKDAVAKLGGEGDTMDDLVKAAIMYPARAMPAPVQPAPPAPEKPKITLGNRFRALLLGMEPGKLQSLQRGASSLAGIFDKLRSVGLMPTG